jgi:hypothetical protein
MTSQSESSVSIVQSVSDREPTQNDNTIPAPIPCNSPSGMLKAIVARYPSLTIWKRPWKNPLFKFPLTFTFSTLNAISMMIFCLQPANWNENRCQKSSVSCLSFLTCGQPVTPYSFWFSQPEYYASASEFPCSVFLPGVLSLASSFPRSSYKYASYSPLSLTTVAVCTDASLQQFQMLFVDSVKSSMLFKSSLFHGDARRVLPGDANAPYTITDLFSQFVLPPYNPTPQTSPSQYSPCCTDNFCVEQLKSSTTQQPYKFVWGAIPAITDSLQPGQVACKNLMGCSGSLSMVPTGTNASSFCSENVYVFQATIGISGLFRALFLFFLLMDLLLTLSTFIAIFFVRKLAQPPVTPESIANWLTDFPLEFYQELHAAGNLERYMHFLEKMFIQLAADAAQTNVVTSTFGEFYLLLNSKTVYSNEFVLEVLGMYRNSAFGRDESGTYELKRPFAPTLVFRKHWKSVASRMRGAPFRLIFAILTQVLVSIVYPLLSLLTISSCQSNDRNYKIAVLCWSVFSISQTIFDVCSSTWSLSKQMAE